MRLLILKYVNLSVLLLIAVTTASAQIKIYKGDSRSSFDLLLEIKDSLVYSTHTSFNRDPIYTFMNNELYGYDSFRRPLDKPFLYIENNKIKINDSFRKNVIYTIDRDNIHLGDGTYMSNTIAYHISRNKIYLGDSSFNLVLYTIEGNYNIAQIACLLFMGMN